MLCTGKPAKCHQANFRVQHVARGDRVRGNDVWEYHHGLEGVSLDMMGETVAYKSRVWSSY